MKTIKLPYKSDYNIADLMRQYTILVKSCHNRIIDGFDEKQIRLYIKTLNGVGDLDSRFVENALIDAKALNGGKIIFNRFNYNKRYQNKLTRKEYKESKYLPIINYGELKQKGNRKFKIDMENNKIIFKLNRKNHINIILPKLKQNYQKKLEQLQVLMGDCRVKVSFKLDRNYIYISYEEPEKQTIMLKNNRVLGLDLNPNCIGYSILEFKGVEYKLLEKGFIDLFEINKYHRNKKNYELVLISKQIIQLMKAFNVGNLAVEDLNMVTKNHNKGKKYNKLVNNIWNRNLFVNNLINRCGIEGIKVYKTNPAYTSIIGNLMFDYYDPTNASIEVARRGFLFHKMYIKNSFYPKFNLKSQWNQWKKETNLFFNDWKSFYLHLKTLNMKYRVPLEKAVFKDLCRKNIQFSVF